MESSSQGCTPGLSPAATSSWRSEDGLAPATPNGQNRDSGIGQFIIACLPAKEALESAYDQRPSYGGDSLLSGSADSPAKEIEYTIQPWATGFVLIAATKAGICWLGAGNSAPELNETLRQKFPLADINISAWPETSQLEATSCATYFMFSEVMEALINPTGKILDISFDVF